MIWLRFTISQDEIEASSYLIMASYENDV